MLLSLIEFPISAQETGNLMLKYGREFLGTPYVAHTLEAEGEERLIIHRSGVDCTTFVEYVLAESLIPPTEHEEDSGEAFAEHLRSIRYRDGIIDGYPSRLHYITDWINNGIKHGFLRDITARHGTDSLTLSLSFMSSHPEAYRQLAASPADVERMRNIEKALSGTVIRYLPKEKLPDRGVPYIQNGDIIAITTDIPGLDIAHIGLACYQQGELKLLHASSSAQQVVITSGSLAQWLKRNQRFTGVRVIRKR